MIINYDEEYDNRYLQEIEGGYQGEQRLISCVRSRLKAALASQVEIKQCP